MRKIETSMLFALLVAVGTAQQARSQANAPQNPVPSPSQGKEKTVPQDYRICRIYRKPVQAPAQGEEKAKDTAKKPAKPAGKAKTKATEPETPARPTIKSKLDPDARLYAELGYEDWGLSGNQSKFRQYATPPQGFFLRDFRYAPELRTPSEQALFELKGIGEDDYLAAAKGVWSYGATQASGFVRNSKFFDPSAGAIAPSAWRTEGLNLRQALSRDFALTFQSRSNSQQLNFQIPYPGLDQNTDYWDAIAAGKLGKGFVRLNFSNFHYADETGTLLNFDAQTVGLSYLWTPSSRIGIEAGGSDVTIAQPGLPSSHVDTLSLGSDLTLSPTTDFSMLLLHRQVGLPTVQTAYTRNQNRGTFSLAHRFKSWRAQVGLRLQNDERVNGDQTNVDVPKWSTLEARLSGRLAPNIRLTLRGSTESLSDPPASTLSDPRTLYWTNRNFAQARLEGGTPDINAYLVYTYRVNRNSQRLADVTTEQYTIGSTWQIAPLINLFAEYHHENWTGRTDTTDFPALNNFLPDSDTSIVELNWTPGRRTSIALSYTGFSSYNDNPLLLQDGNARGSFFTINTHYRLSGSDEIGLLVAPWTYHDSVSSALNYDAAVFMVTGSARFK